MIITERTQFVKDGNPIEELTVEECRFDRISILVDGDEMVVRAREVSSETVVEETFTKVPNKLFKPVVHAEKSRRDVDDNLQDALGSIGYAAVDGSVIDD